LATQRSILEVSNKFIFIWISLTSAHQAYLQSLQLPAVAASVRAAFLPAEENSLPESEGASESDEADVGQTYEPNTDFLAASYPTLQPIKLFVIPFTSPEFSLNYTCSSTLYRRRATGFGEWEINIAPRAERDLREYNRRERKTFDVIVKKMRYVIIHRLQCRHNLTDSEGTFRTGLSLQITTNKSMAAISTSPSTKLKWQNNCDWW
jgi:hypothetical protein